MNSSIHLLTIINQRSGIQTACKLIKANKKRTVVTKTANTVTNIKNPR